MKAKVDASETQSKQMQTRLQKVEREKGGAEGPDKKACFICGGDHLARNCPNKKNGKKPTETEVEEE